MKYKNCIDNVFINQEGDLVIPCYWTNAKKSLEEIKNNTKIRERLEAIDISFLIQMMRSNYEIQKVEKFKDIADQLTEIQSILQNKESTN